MFKAKSIKKTQKYYSGMRSIMAQLESFTDGSNTNRRELHKLHDKVIKLESKYINDDDILIPKGDVYLMFGTIFMLYANWEASIKAFNKCITINKEFDCSNAHRYKGLILLNEYKDIKGALKEFYLCRENLLDFSKTEVALEKAEIILTRSDDLGVEEVDELIADCQERLKTKDS